MKTLEEYLKEEIKGLAIEEDEELFLNDSFEDYREEIKDAFNGDLCGGY